MGEALGIALQLTIVGMAVVFLALTLLVLLLTLFKRLDARLSRPKEVINQMDLDKVPTMPVSTEELAPELVAAISAAAAIATTRKIRITRIRYRGERPEPAWSRQGRTAIMGSHQVRR